MTFKKGALFVVLTVLDIVCAQPATRCDITAFLLTDNPFPTGDSNLVGAVVTFVCQQGFVLQGEATLTCQADGTWSDNSPTCQREALLCALRCFGLQTPATELQKQRCRIVTEVQ